MRNSSFLSSKEICQVISDMKILKFNLTVEDIETILDALVFEEKVEKSTTSDGNCDEQVKMYRTVASTWSVPSNNVCLFFKFKSYMKTIFLGYEEVLEYVGAIQPNCSYFNEWLNVE